MSNNELPTVEPSQSEIEARVPLRYRFMQSMPFLNRYLELTAPNACCGVCPTCIGTAAAGLIIPALQDKMTKSE